MDLPEIEVALDLFKLLPTHRPRPEGIVTEMTVEERAVFETCCAVIRRATAAGTGRRQE